ncbi:hypothetical protein L9F63_012734 [Diploptera punctata]|uniref:Glucose-methanol-choline oxidoreductase N-terminal domain-containing protein n=1 Tax=Diploptera punctata TaxID=6984 RepID=A0AAD8EMX8_DIPPU|nr:hypothetical protein L9F63_012734 [Diploptera punctata]
MAADDSVSFINLLCNILRELFGCDDQYFLKEGTKHFEEEPRDEANILAEYDFIIVGAGSAGCVLANRLSEVSGWNILLIEAGGKENYVMDIPLTVTSMQFTEANWMYKLEPSGNVCLAMWQNRCLVPRGKVMGGSSTINFMIYTRGNKHNYNRWEQMGNPGWGYKDVLPYFLKLENMSIPELRTDSIYHSTSGEVPVNYAPYRTPLADAFLEAGKELGIHILHPIRNRKNLHVKKWSLVTKILIEPSEKVAYGSDNSAGAVNSPQLLMLSGIGPSEHLTEKNIEVIQDLKVGYNLMDHIGILSINFIVNQSVSLREWDLIKDFKFVEYMSSQTGPFTVPGASEAVAFYDSNDPFNPDGDPDFEFMLFSSCFSSTTLIHHTVGIRQNIYDKIYKPIEKYHAWSGVPIVLKPFSRGQILLRTKDPRVKPLIYFDFLKDERDLEAQLFGVKKIIEISKTEAFQKYGSRLNDIPIPGCEKFVLNSDDYWKCAIRHFSFPVWHLGGTCKMGPKSDTSAVVDSTLKVYGVKNLRVIDASIMPELPAAHTHVPAMMIGEKGADLIKQEWEFKNAL